MCLDSQSTSTSREPALKRNDLAVDKKSTTTKGNFQEIARKAFQSGELKKEQN